jgi:hypothetical protein
LPFLNTIFLIGKGFIDGGKTKFPYHKLILQDKALINNEVLVKTMYRLC